MIVYVICCHTEYDSYHQVDLVTVDKTEAEKSVKSFNEKHEPGCSTQRPTWSDFDECFCKRRHLHALPLSGLSPDVRFDKPALTC